MRILFLDIDGVLCTRRSHMAYGKEGGVWDDWDPLGCAVIRQACEKGVTIAISSTWRKSMHQKNLFGKLNKHDLYRFVFWAGTPSLWHTPITSGKRGEEIQQWLDRAASQWHEPIEDYRILDDDNDMLEHQIPKCIFTDAEDGMTSDNIKKLLNWSGAWKA